MDDKEENRCIAKTHVGRFQISIWKYKRVVPAQIGKWWLAEHEHDLAWACIQYSYFNCRTRNWEIQTIWCGTTELRNFATVLGQLEEDSGGDDVASCFLSSTTSAPRALADD